MTAVGMRGQRPLPPMTASIAVPAGGNDVGPGVTAAVLSCLQMFRSALKVACGTKPQAQFGRGRKPHSAAAVVALPVLCMKCDDAKGLTAGHMEGSEEIKMMIPAPSMRYIGHPQPYDYAGTTPTL